MSSEFEDLSNMASLLVADHDVGVGMGLEDPELARELAQGLRLPTEGPAVLHACAGSTHDGIRNQRALMSTVVRPQGRAHMHTPQLAHGLLPSQC